jgi:hypothetical protein
MYGKSSRILSKIKIEPNDPDAILRNDDDDF